ncbi:MAG TPA: hypothetical protein VIL97_06430 [Thermoanaerobaculia bacterium]
MKSWGVPLVLLLALACAGEKTTFPDNPPPQRAPSAATTAPVESPSFSAETQKQVNDALDAYDDIRGTLSNDQTEGVAQAAARLEIAATAAASQSATPANGKLSAIAAEASKVKVSGNLDQTRVAFGGLSRAVVAFLDSEPSLAQKRHLFSCPMTKGYSKWVQSTKSIGNPYMGRKMIACGEEEQEWGI